MFEKLAAVKHLAAKTKELTEAAECLESKGDLSVGLRDFHFFPKMIAKLHKLVN